MPRKPLFRSLPDHPAIFGCEWLTGALLNRLTHRLLIIEANSPTYRLRQLKQRLRKRGAKTHTDAKIKWGRILPDVAAHRANTEIVELLHKRRAKE